MFGGSSMFSMFSMFSGGEHGEHGAVRDDAALYLAGYLLRVGPSAPTWCRCSRIPVVTEPPNSDRIRMFLEVRTLEKLLAIFYRAFLGEQ